MKNAGPADEELMPKETYKVKFFTAETRDEEFATRLPEGGIVGIDSKDVEFATQLHLRGKLAMHAVSEGIKARTKLQKTISKSKNKSEGSAALRAGLQFIPEHVAYFSQMHILERECMSLESAVYLAAVVEYLCAEVRNINILSLSLSHTHTLLIHSHTLSLLFLFSFFWNILFLYYNRLWN